MKTNLLDLDPKALIAYFADVGEKPFRATQLLKWVYQEQVFDFELMTNFSKKFREFLIQNCELKIPFIKTEKIASDGTRKWLVELADGNHIETVFIPETNRGTLCVSSQIGCALNCTFCSTATQGFNRNLSTSEIIGQVCLASSRINSDQKITNIVMMGMGEPLLNTDNVFSAMNIMRHDNAFGLPRRRVTLSTSGVVPKITDMIEKTDVALAISLHAPNDELRNVLVPINKKYNIDTLLTTLKNYQTEKPKHEILIEYVMLKDVNDSVLQAKQLGTILERIKCKVNLIPFNPYPGSKYQCSDFKAIKAFQDRLMRSGYVATIRKTRGEDIDAACGQLVGEFMDRTKRNVRFIKSRLVENDV